MGGLANRLKTITGKASWRDAPDATLADAASHHGRTDNPHSLTRSQIGAAAATALDSHTASQNNPHGVSAAQAGAREATWVPGWSDVTGKPVSFPSSWNEVTGKPSSFVPSAHKGSHASGGADALAPTDIGAAPSSRTISTTAPLSGGGTLAANRALSISAATGSAAGSMSAADKTKLDELVAVGPGLSGNGRGATPVVPRVYGFVAADQNGQANISLPYATNVKVPLVNEIADTENAFSAGVYTAPVGGRYTIYGGARVSRMADQDVMAVFVTRNTVRDDGAEIVTVSASGTSGANLSGSAVVTLAAGDKLEMFIRMAGSAGSPVMEGGARTFFNIGLWGAL